MTAAMDRTEVDGMVSAIEVGAQLQAAGQVNVLLSGGADRARLHHAYHLLARRLHESNPELVGKFIDAWFKTVAWMRTHRDRDDRDRRQSRRPGSQSRGLLLRQLHEVDAEQRNFSQKALDRLAKSWLELGILTTAANPNTLISTQFVKVVA